MGVEELSESNGYGAFVRIAILDSGVPHPFLGYGYNVWSSVDYKEHPDEFGHATEIASMLFGGIGIVGICGLAKPVYIKVLDSQGDGSVDSVADGILEAISMDVDIINLSLGFMRTEKCPEKLENACRKAYEAGKTVICAAGNDGGAVNWPAALDTTICVGSSSENGIKNAFSSIGEVDFVAPGSNLSVVGIDGEEKKVSGTSFSAALVSGVAALILHGMKKERKRHDMHAVREALKGIARDVDSPGWDENTGYGMIASGSLDPVTGMKIESGFFDRISCKIRRLIGINKRSRHGRV